MVGIGGVVAFLEDNRDNVVAYQTDNMSASSAPCPVVCDSCGVDFCACPLKVVKDSRSPVQKGRVVRVNSALSAQTGLRHAPSFVEAMRNRRS